MQQYGEFFPENPTNLAELIDSLARRAAATQRLMDSSPPSSGPSSAVSCPGDGQLRAGRGDGPPAERLRAARPDLQWGAPSAWTATGRWLFRRHRGTGRDRRARRPLRAHPAGLPRRQPGRHRRGPRAARPGPPSRRRPRPAAPHRARAATQGYLERGGDGLQLTPERCGGWAPQRCGASSRRSRTAAGAITTCATPAPRAKSPGPPASGASATSSRSTSSAPSATRCCAAGARRSAWSRGLRGGRDRAAQLGGGGPARRHVVLDGTARHLGEAKTTALALHSLVSTKYPQDSIEIIGFSDYARVMTPRALVDHDWDRVQGTNLQHALMLARRTSTSTATPSRSSW